MTVLKDGRKKRVRVAKLQVNDEVLYDGHWFLVDAVEVNLGGLCNVTFKRGSKEVKLPMHSSRVLQIIRRQHA